MTPRKNTSGETALLKAIQMDLSNGRTRLWRNQVGEAWQGIVTPAPSGPWAPGSLIIQHPRRINFGLCTGSADLVGYTTVAVTADMMGQHVAVFTGVEVKSGSGRASEEQKAWLSVVTQAGGFSGIARSIQDAREILRL